MFAPCGMNCKVCYKHLLNKKPCLGCLHMDEGKPEHCKHCDIKQCAYERGFDYCFMCDDLPCERLKRLDKSYQKRYAVSLLQNNLETKQMGIAAFLASDKEKWTCQRCGGIVSLHDAECSECGLLVRVK